MQTWKRNEIVINIEAEIILFAADWLLQVTGEPEDVIIHSWIRHAKSMKLSNAIHAAQVTGNWFNANS